MLRVGSDFPDSSNVQAIFLNYPWSEGLLLEYLKDMEVEAYVLVRISIHIYF